MQTLQLKLTVTAVKLLHLTHQGLTGADPDAMPGFMVAPMAAEIFEFEIRVMEVRAVQ